MRIKTDRLILEQLTKEKLKEVSLWPLDKQLSFFGKANKEQLELKIERIKSYWDTSMVFVLMEKSHDKVIGFCGFYRWFKEHRRTEIGYVLLEEYRKKGYMREAVEVLLKYAFEELNINRMEAVIEPSNSASVNLAKHFQFKEEGLMRQHYIHKGKITDSLMFSLLKEDWL